MAKGTRGSGLDFTARLNTAEALKRAKEFRAELEALKKASGISTRTVAPDTRSINAAKASQDALRRSLLEGQVAAQQLRNENLALRNSYNEGRISAQQLAAAEKQARADRLRLAEATRTARQAQVAASGSYDEANNRLKALGRSIRSAEDGFRSTNPAIRAQIAEYNSLNKSLKDFDARMGNHQRNVGNYKSVLDGALASLGSLVTGYISIQGAISLANQAFEVALKNDAIKTSLAFTLGSVEAADDKMKELKITADRLGLSFTPLATTYSSFAGAARAANFDLNETNRIFNSVSGAAARFHLSSDQLAGSLLAIQQMISKGTVQSEELRGQLGERLPGAFSIAARAMGVSEKELGKLLQTGQVLASDLLPKLATELDKTFNLDASTKIDSLTASTNRLSTAWDKTLQSDGAGKFFKKLIDGATAAITSIDKLLSSRSLGELSNRLFSFDASNSDKANAISDNYNESSRFYANNRLNPLGTSNKNVISSLAGNSLEDLEKLRAGYLKATKQAEQAVNIYRKAIKTGDLSDGGKIRLKEAEANFKTLQNNLMLVNTAYAAVEKNKKKASDTPIISDADLKSVAEINKRILELKNDALANPGNKASNVERISELKKRLKELNGPIKEAADTALNARNNLQKSINDLTKKGTDKQLSADEQEVESVKKKYADMLAAARKFNNDPSNRKRGLRVDAGGLTRAEDREIVALNDKHEAEKLKASFDVQKKLYEDFENYKNQVGEDNANKRYDAELGGYETYLDALKAKRDQLLNQDQKSKGGAESDNAAIRLQLEAVDKEIVEENRVIKKRTDERFADAYQAALTHSQKLTIIDAEYNRNLKALGTTATKDQIVALTKERDAKRRSVNEENAYAKSGFEDLMLEFDALTRGAVLKRLSIIKAGYQEEYRAGQLTAEQLAGLVSNVNQQINRINGDNVFKKISASIQNYKDQVKLLGKDSNGAKEAQADLFNDIADGANQANSVVSALAASFEQLNIGGEGLQQTFKSIQGVVGGAGSIAKGLAPGGNPIDVITGSIGLLTSAISLFSHKDKNLQKKIDGYKRELDELGRAYAKLDRAVQNSVGESIYTDQAAEIENLQKQQAKLIQMRDAEVDKKKTDQDKVQEYNDQIADIPNKIDDINKAISQNLIQTTFKDLSQSLADAFTDAFAAGEDALGRFDDVFDKVIQNAVKNSLKLKLIEPIVKNFTDELTKYASANGNSVIGFDFDKYKALLKDAGDKYTEGLAGLGDLFKADVDNGSSALSNSIKGISSDQANALDGILRGSYDVQKRILINTDSSRLDMGEMLRMGQRKLQQLEAINLNTAETVKRLDFTLDALKIGNKSLADIASNTKPINIRGNGLGG